MLVLSRKKGDKISIGGGIVVTVLEVGRGKIRLGIDAPPDTKVLRAELADDEPSPGSAPHPRPAGQVDVPKGSR